MKIKVWLVMFMLFLVVVPSAIHAQETTGAWTGTHTVQSGETLGRIALRYGIGVNALASANGISNLDLIYAGQVLRVPIAGTPGSPAPIAGQPFDVSVTSNTNVYEGQSFNTAVRFVLPVGTVSAVGRSADSTWIYIRSAYGVQGWVSSASVVADTRLRDALPVVSLQGGPIVPNVYTINIPSSTNVHLIPNATAPLRAVITPGTVIVNGRSQDGNWLSINAYNGIQGWVLTSAAQVDPSMLYALTVTYRPPVSTGQPSNTMQATIIRAGIPLRSAPGGATPVIRSVSQQSVTVLARSWDNAWLRVRMADRVEGWLWLGDTNLRADQIVQLPSI